MDKNANSMINLSHSLKLDVIDLGNIFAHQDVYAELGKNFIFF